MRMLISGRSAIDVCVVRAGVLGLRIERIDRALPSPYTTDLLLRRVNF